MSAAPGAGQSGECRPWGPFGRWLPVGDDEMNGPHLFWEIDTAGSFTGR